MMRLPRFHYFAPTGIAEATELLATATPGDAMIVAGGTDLLPNMKRRQQTPGTLIGLRRIPELQRITNGDGMTVGAGVTLAALLRDGLVRHRYAGLWQAAAQIATPHLRNMGTIGGNLCLDTRCNYYDQNYEWRQAIDFCMKKDGDICWVATSSARCLAVSSTDLAPALVSLGASVTLASAERTRTIALADLYRNDGISYLTRQPSELLTAVTIPPLDGWRSTYWKLRRRGAFDFPVLSVAASARIGADGAVEAAHVVLGAVASRPMDAPEAAAFIVGDRLTDERIESAADLAARPARPMDNTDFGLVWRKRMTKALVGYALRELRGDDMRECRRRVARQLL